MPIISSSYAVGTTQADGRSYVDERHVAADGQAFRFEYLWNSKDGSDPKVVMQLRARRLDEQLATIEASQQIVDAGRRTEELHRTDVHGVVVGLHHHEDDGFGRCKS